MRVMARLEGWTLYSEAPRMIPTPTPSNVHQINIFIRNHLLLNRFHRLFFFSWPAATSGFRQLIHSTCSWIVGNLVTLCNFLLWLKDVWTMQWLMMSKEIFPAKFIPAPFLAKSGNAGAMAALGSLLRPRLRPFQSTCNLLLHLETLHVIVTLKQAYRISLECTSTSQKEGPTAINSMLEVSNQFRNGTASGRWELNLLQYFETRRYANLLPMHQKHKNNIRTTLKLKSVRYPGSCPPDVFEHQQIDWAR